MIADHERNLHEVCDNENSIDANELAESNLQLQVGIVCLFCNINITKNWLKYLQITDEDGNAIPLSIQEARQLLAQGHFISQLNGGQTIRVQSMDTPLENTSDMEVATSSIKENTSQKVNTASSIQSDAEAIAKVLEVRTKIKL